MILGFNFKISEMFNDGSSILWSQVENYKITNYEPENAKERFEGAIIGKGTLFYKNGQKLIGNFRWGQINGSAKLFSANGDILKSGTFKGTGVGLYVDKEEVKIKQPETTLCSKVFGRG
jgi:antitoxin component YwqK of YwqJK toxin-antitoxin module